MVLVVPEQSQRPYRFGMTLLCVGALFNWLGLADTYSDPVPAIRYIGVGLIAAGASLICMAMCFWMRNIHDPSLGNEYDVSSDPVHVISVDPTLEKPPDYSTVVDVPPCYEDAIKLSPSTLASVHKTAKSGAPTNNAADGRNANCARPHTERNNSLQCGQSSDAIDFPAIAADCRPPTATAEKSEDDFVCTSSSSSSSSSCQSSQNENALAKVLRKSIRGIRRLRSGSEDSCNSSTALQPAVESGMYNADSNVEPTSKVNR